MPGKPMMLWWTVDDRGSALFRGRTKLETIIDLKDAPLISETPQSPEASLLQPTIPLQVSNNALTIKMQINSRRGPPPQDNTATSLLLIFIAT